MISSFEKSQTTSFEREISISRAFLSLSATEIRVFPATARLKRLRRELGIPRPDHPPGCIHRPFCGYHALRDNSRSLSMRLTQKVNGLAHHRTIAENVCLSHDVAFAVDQKQPTRRGLADKRIAIGKPLASKRLLAAEKVKPFDHRATQRRIPTPHLTQAGAKSNTQWVSMLPAPTPRRWDCDGEARTGLPATRLPIEPVSEEAMMDCGEGRDGALAAVNYYSQRDRVAECATTSLRCSTRIAQSTFWGPAMTSELARGMAAWLALAWGAAVAEDAKSEIREWTDASGKFTVQAEFVRSEYSQEKALLSSI